MCGEKQRVREQQIKPLKCDNDAIKTFVNVLQSCVGVRKHTMRRM